MKVEVSQRLSRKDVKAAIRFQNPPRPAIAHAMPCESQLWDQYKEELEDLSKTYPDDIAFTNVHVDYWHGPGDEPGYCWAIEPMKIEANRSIDNRPILDWKQLNEFIRTMPDPNHIRPFEQVTELKKQNPERYLLVSFGHYFNQKLASMRGIENLLFDFVDNKSELQTILDALMEYYTALAKRVKQAGADGIYGGDDLGTQRSLFMSPTQYREIYKPYYIRFAEMLHSLDLDFWLHTCGNVTEIMDDLIESGVDVLHPIQVGTMDDEYIARQYSGKICFHIGMDVQHLIPFETPDTIRAGIKERAQLFYRPQGGCIYGAGNVLTAGIPIENIRAYVESLHQFCQKMNRSKQE